MAPDYLFNVACVQDLTWKPKRFHITKPKLSVSVKLGETKQRISTVAINSAPTWDSSVILPSPRSSSTIHVELVNASNGIDVCIGWIDIKLSSLLQQCANDEVTRLSLEPPDGGASSTHACILHVRVGEAVSSIGNQISATVHAIERRRIDSASTSTAVANVNDGSNFEEDSLYQSIGGLFASLDVFVNVIDALTGADPYLKLAWTVVSAIYKVVSYQFKCDKKIVDLVHNMGEAFSIVNEIGSVRDKTQILKKVIIQLLQQTHECCLFVQQYASRSFFERVLDMSSRAKINDFEQSFVTLKLSLDSIRKNRPIGILGIISRLKAALIIRRIQN